MRGRLVVALLAVAGLMGTQLARADHDDHRVDAAPSGRSAPVASTIRLPGALPTTPPATTPSLAVRRPAMVLRKVVIGYSRQHRPIEAYEVGDPRLPSVLVVGCIHGSEAAGVPVARWLVSQGRSFTRVHLWIVPVLNPDGMVAGTRTNAAGVDLNRNFPYRWAIRNRGTLRDSGPYVLSEPESQAIAGLVRSARPTYGVWFHQALAVVDDSQGPPEVELLLSRALQLPERRLPDYPGSAVGWEDQLRSRSAFVVELRAGQPSHSEVHAAGQAIVAAAQKASRH